MTAPLAPTTAGTATDATHGSSTHFGIRIEQSSAAGPVNNHSSTTSWWGHPGT